MASINTVISGNATVDPSAYTFEDGSLKSTFTVAVNDSYYDPNTKEWKERKTEFIRVQVRKRNLAEHVLKSVRKGAPVIVTGRLASHGWEGRDGTQRTELVLHAEQVGIELTHGIAKYTKTAKNWVNENDGEAQTRDSASTESSIEAGFSDSNFEVAKVPAGAPF